MQEYASKYKDSIEKIVLISSPYPDYKPYYTDAFLKTGLPPQRQEDANKWYIEHIEDFFGKYFYVHDAIKIFDKTLSSYAVSAHVGGRKYKVPAKLEEVNIPTLILVGGMQEHPLSRIKTANKLEDLLPKAEVKQIKNSGHFMFAEATVEFQKIVNEWINK